LSIFSYLDRELLLSELDRERPRRGGDADADREEPLLVWVRLDFFFLSGPSLSFALRDRDGLRELDRLFLDGDLDGDLVSRECLLVDRRMGGDSVLFSSMPDFSVEEGRANLLGGEGDAESILWFSTFSSDLFEDFLLL